MIIAKKPLNRYKKVKLTSILIFALIICSLVINSPLFSYLNKNDNLYQDSRDEIKSIKSSDSPLEANFFKYYKVITIDHTKLVQPTYINFPFLISVFDLDLHEQVQDNGNDIAFAIDTLWLDHEIDLFNKNYNTTHAKLIVWVRIPSLSGSVDTNITMYYGNSTMNSRQNPSGVWLSNYKGVWHLSESTGNVLDSTLYTTSGTPSGTITRGQTGVISGAYDFGNNGQINFGDPSDGHLDMGTGSCTISFWVNIDGATGNYQLPLYKGATTYSDIGYDFETSFNGETLSFRICDGTNIAESPNMNVDFDNWIYIVGVVDRTSNYIRIFKNGMQQGSGSSTSGLGNINNNKALLTPTATYDLDGLLDEIRIANVPRSAGWINTEYENQRNPSSFYSVGTQKIIPKELSNANYFTFYKTITINHTKISGSGSHVNFPILISILDNDLRFKVQPDGDDIAFAQDNEWLDHEIELFNQSYNTTHAQLIAWVRVPFLYTNVNTNISMYYSNSTMNSRQNPIGVWNSNYKGVWHLSESSGVARDSTSYSNNGTPSGGIAQGRIGQIDGAYDFDAIDDVVNMGDPVDGHLDFGTQSFSFSLWVNCPLTSQYQDIFYKGAREDAVAGYCFYRRYAAEGGSATVSVGDGTARIKNDFTITSDVWEYIVAVIDRTTKKSHVYKNGVEQGTGVDISSLGSVDSTISFRLGDGYDNADATVDEVRIAKSVYSASWIQTEYNNQYDPNSFYSVDIEQSVIDNPPNSEDFNYYKIITINHSKVSGDNSLINFPLLISIFDSDLKYDVQSDGDDIGFAQNGKWLSHEIEKFNQTFNSTHAKLTGWVRVPYLYPLNDMNITMYYGNDTMGPRQNPNEVWDNNYKSVWHFNEASGTGDYVKDSTVNDYDGTPFGTQFYETSIIDGARYFTQSGDNRIIINRGSEFFNGNNIFTFSFWIYPNYASDQEWYDNSEGRVFYKTTSISLARIYRTYHGPGLGSFQPDIRFVTYGTTYMERQISRQQWSYVTYCYDGTYLRSYINGKSPSSINIGGYPLVSDTSSFYFGSATYSFKGYLDEFRVLNIARDQPWSETEYNNQYSPNLFYSVGEEQIAKGLILRDVQVNAVDLYGNQIPNVNISMYSNSQLIRNGISNATGSIVFLGVPQAEYNFTASITSDIGNQIEIINKTSEAILLDLPFKSIYLSCNVGTNFFEIEDVDGLPLDSGWIVVGNSTHNLRNCTIDLYGKTKFWWVNTTPYQYNYTVYYQDNQYEPKIIKLTSGNINTANSTIPIQVELTSVDFRVLTFAGGEGVSGIKIKVRLNDPLGMSIVNLTTNQDGAASLRWFTSLGLSGNYSIELEFYSENKLFNTTIGGPASFNNYSFEVLNKLSLEFRISISLADFQTELVSLNPTDYIELNWGEILKLRILFNVTKAGTLDHLLGPSYTDLMVFNVIRGGQIIKSGTFSIEQDNIGRHFASIDSSLLESRVIYLVTISAHKSGYSLPSNLILQLSILENDLVLNQSENDDSPQSVYWLQSTDMSVEPYGVTSEEFTIQEALFQDESHNFVFSLPDLENQWNLSQVILNIYNISWTVGASDINLTIIDPYGKYYIFHASNHTGENYALGEWTGISIDLNKASPTLNNNFEFVIGGSFLGTVDIIAETYFIRNKIGATYVKFNITDKITILTEKEGWAIKEIRFDIFNCYDSNTWNLIDPLSDAHLNVTTNEGFKYSLDTGYTNGTGNLIIDNRLVLPLSGEFLFSIESSVNVVFDVILYVDYIQEFYQNDYLEELNSFLAVNNINNGGVLHISVVDNDWIEESALLEINGINNGISYFSPSELTMRINIGGQIFNIVDLSKGYGFFSLDNYNKDFIYSAIITTNQQVNFTLDFILKYSRTTYYEVLGTVSYSIVQAPSIQGNVPYDSNLGCYIKTIDTSVIDADDYTIRFIVEKDHYTSAVKDLQLIVLNRLTLINGSSDFYRTYQTIYVRDAINLTFSYIDALVGTGINNLDILSYIWESYDEIGNVVEKGGGSLIFNSNGRYILDFDTELRSVGEYLLIVTVDKDNYDNRNAMVLLNIEKRIFNYTLGDNFQNRQATIVKGGNLLVEIRLYDLTRGNIILENATITLTIEGIEYDLEEFESGRYMLAFPTDNFDAFFAPKVLTGNLNVSKTDFISQEFEITIIVGMEEIFPGIPTFYFLLILVGIISIAGSVTVYRVYKKAKIPRFVKKVRAIAKAIEKDSQIPVSLIYKEKEVYIGELVNQNWEVLGLSLANILGIEISKIKPSKKRPSISEKLQEYTPIGLALMRWNERIGTEIIAKYPEDIKLSDKSLMQIYSTHEYSGDKGVVTLMDGALNLVSYYTGPDQGYYLILLLDLNDDPDAYESGMVDILQTILRNLQDESYIKLLPSLFQRLSVFPSYNEEQMFYYTYRNEIKRMILHYLQEDGVIAKSELSIWLKDVYKEGFVDIDSAIAELMKMGVIKQVSLKGSPSELIFLTKDVFMLRVPPMQLLKDPKKLKCPANIRKDYQSEVKKFFQNYTPTKEDNLTVIDILSLPQVYEVFKLIRTSIVTIQDLEKLRKKGVEDVYGILKMLWDNNIIKVFHDEKNVEYFALLSDFYVDYIFPKYITRVIKQDYEQKSKANTILIEYLKILEQTYFNTQKKSK